MARKLFLALFLGGLVVAGSLAGCLRAPHLEPLRYEFARQLEGAKFQKEFEITLGPISLWFVRVASGWIKDEDLRHYRSYLRKLRRVEVGVYEVRNLPGGRSSMKAPARLRSMLRDGWQTAIRVREPETSVWILYRERAGRLRRLQLVILDDNSLVMARVSGRLGDLLRLVVTENLKEVKNFRE